MWSGLSRERKVLLTIGSFGIGALAGINSLQPTEKNRPSPLPETDSSLLQRVPESQNSGRRKKNDLKFVDRTDGLNDLKMPLPS